MNRRLQLATVLAFTVITAACAPTANTTGTPWCDDFSVLILEAQSVPEAQLLPCVDLMPLGWSVGDTLIDDHGTGFTLRSAIAGSDAARVQLSEACVTEGYVRVPTDEADTERFEFVSRITDGFEGGRIYTFEGGCASIDFAFDADVSAALVNEVSLTLGFVPRAEVNEAVRVATDGREQVDPPFED
jgi:hypothetical protein